MREKIACLCSETNVKYHLCRLDEHQILVSNNCYYEARRSQKHIGFPSKITSLMRELIRHLPKLVGFFFKKKKKIKRESKLHII